MLDMDAAERYVRRRKRRKAAAIVAGIASVGLVTMTAVALLLFRTDRFTITAEGEQKLCLTVDAAKEDRTTRLVAPPLLRAADTQYTEVIESLDEGLGSKSTDQYFAYSFYLGGIGDEADGSINYNMAMTLNEFSNGLEDAIRIMVLRNGEPTVYAKPMEGGAPRPIYEGIPGSGESPETIGMTKPFRSNKNIIVEAYEIEPGEFDKYTVAMWIDGWESVDEMKGGVFSADLKFSTKSIN